MIQSMTAFARLASQGQWGSAICEIRTINHRYLDLSLRLPDNLRELEIPIREHLRKAIQRGKVECMIRLQPNEALNTEIKINSDLVEKLCKANKEIATSVRNTAPVNPMDILQWPGVIETADIDTGETHAAILSLIDGTVNNLIEMRAREGKELAILLEQRLAAMQKEILKVKVRLPHILEGQRSRLLARFNEAKIDLEPTRVEQEIVLLAQRIDVSEELDRLDTHIHEVRHSLKQGANIGRRLDFLMQELNREANTLGSKSIDAETTHAAVELKVLIEQMREQVQNIE